MLFLHYTYAGQAQVSFSKFKCNLNNILVSVVILGSASAGTTNSDTSFVKLQDVSSQTKNPAQTNSLVQTDICVKQGKYKKTQL